MTPDQLAHLRQLFYDYGSACTRAARCHAEEDTNQASDEVDKTVTEFEELLKELHANVPS